MNVHQNSIFSFASINKDDSLSDNSEVIFSFLKYFGIDIVKSSNRHLKLIKLSKYIYPLYAYISLTAVITMGTCHMINTLANAKTNVAFIIMNIFSLILWHALHKKRDSLRCICKKLIQLSGYNLMSTTPKPYFIKVFLILNFALIIICATMHVIGLSEADYFCQIFSYHTWTKCKDGILNRLYIFIIVIVVHFVTSTFINIIAFFYCLLCSRCSSLLRRYRESFRRILHIKNFNKEETHMAQEYFNILNLIENIEYAFSLPSLLLLMVCFMQVFVSLQDLW